MAHKIRIIAAVQNDADYSIIRDNLSDFTEIVNVVRIDSIGKEEIRILREIRREYNSSTVEDTEKRNLIEDMLKLYGVKP